MKLSDYNEVANSFSGKLSDITRQIAFGGIAIIWLFKITVNNTTTIPIELISPSKYILIALAIDVLHYAYQSIAWTIFFYVRECKYQKTPEFNKEPDPEMSAPRAMAFIPYIFFIAKIGFVIQAYYQIINFLNDTLIK